MGPFKVFFKQFFVGVITSLVVLYLIILMNEKLGETKFNGNDAVKQ